MRLRYVTQTIPGFTRKKRWGFFAYFDEYGKRIRDKTILRRILSLGIPPAYTDVWICPFEYGHLQATARDARGRTQYIYHAAWVAQRDETKFHRLLAFAGVLSHIRRRVQRDLARRGMPKEKVLATIVRLLDTAYVRIGNEVYAKENHSFGLTTLQHRHVKGAGAHMKLVFRGKHGIVQEVRLEDERLRKIVCTCQDIPGHELFEYLDDDHLPHKITSEDVNEYLREIAREEVTAKDFRTWHATVIAAAYLWRRPVPVLKKDIQARLKAAVAEAAKALGNTAAICKKCYIHPRILSSYREGTFTLPHVGESFRKKYPQLHMEEIQTVLFLSSS